MFDNLYIFDCEVYAHDWVFVFKQFESGQFTVIANDNDALIAFMNESTTLAGFNNKHYDNHILKAVICEFTPEEVKAVNDKIIIDGMNGWDIQELKLYRVYFNSFDLMDDSQDGTSLKGIEAHLGINIKETEVDFNLDRKLSQSELQSVIEYCKQDVNATELLYKLRLPYIKNKVNLGAVCGLNPCKSAYMTNAKLTSVYLQAKAPEKPYKDEHHYVYPDKLLKRYIPNEVFSFFDKFISGEIEAKGASLNISIENCKITLGFGGIHGAIPVYSETESNNRTIRNKDVASYYPHLMTIPLSEGNEYGYCSRSIPTPKIYVDTLEKRVQAKKNGDKNTANALKLVLNTTYGAMLNGVGDTAYNDLYDPLMGRSVCITGQLFLLELAEHLHLECKSLRIIQLNTDGIMVSFDLSDLPVWESITAEWQDRTGFELEEDFIHKIVQKDVNNYIEIPVKGDPKVKGVQLVRGVLTNDNIDFTEYGLHKWDNLSGGAFTLNNNAVAIVNAVKEYFINGTKPEETINKYNNILDFQIISKVGGKYAGCFHEVAGLQFPVQKVNRVYATSDLRKGTIYKIHAKTNSIAKVPSLPKHCIVDNDNYLTVWDIDKEWYVKQAWKSIYDFLGIKQAKKNTRKINSIKKKMLEML